MDSIEIKAWAKLNLSLDVLEKMGNGYHAMRMVMQTVSLCDDLRVSLTKEREFTASANLEYLPGDTRNIAAMAARAFFRRIGETGYGVHVDITKRIPVRAGLGGGSADAAAVLRGLNKMLGAGLAKDELEKIGGGVGSDVPFCVAGGTVLAEGRGEILTSLPPMPDCAIVIIKPEQSISTPELFAKLDCSAIRCRPDTEGMIQALHEGDLKNIAHRVFNVFEELFPRNPGDVAEIKGRLLDLGALGVAMSGTGSAIFGIFDDKETAKNAAETMGQSIEECFLCEPVGEEEI